MPNENDITPDDRSTKYDGNPLFEAFFYHLNEKSVGAFFLEGRSGRCIYTISNGSQAQYQYLAFRGCDGSGRFAAYEDLRNGLHMRWYFPIDRQYRFIYLQNVEIAGQHLAIVKLSPVIRYNVSEPVPVPVGQKPNEGDSVVLV